MYVAMHFAAAAQVLLGLKISCELSAVSFQHYLARADSLAMGRIELKADS
jgi:hypothetical protein